MVPLRIHGHFGCVVWMGSWWNICTFYGATNAKKVLPVLGITALMFSLSIPLYILAISQFPISSSYINFYYMVSAVPFLLGGICMAFLFDTFTHLANRIYFADLAGASLACLCIEPILSSFGAISTILMLGVTTSVGSVLFSIMSRKRKLVAISIIGLTLSSSLFLNNVQHSSISISNAQSKYLFKFLEENPQLPVLTRWNSFSRIDVVEGPWGHVQALIFIDADATTEVLKWDGNLESAQYLRQTIDFLPYCLQKEPRTLIIGSGGGRDVLVALVGGSSKIVAVELNSIIVQVTKDYGEKAGNIYDQDKVEVVIDEGRSFISRSNKKYDVIVLTLVDSWAAMAAGGYALAENYLYTVEAFQQYFDHLTDDGVLIMIRWYLEIPKLVSTSVAALQEKGKSITKTGKHISIILEECESAPGGFRALFMLKKTPFNEEQAKKIRAYTLALSSNHQNYYIPYFHNTTEPYCSLFNGEISLAQFYESFSYKVEPATDDNPYYFCMERPIPETLSNLVNLTSLLAIAVVIIPWVARAFSGNRDEADLL